MQYRPPKAQPDRARRELAALVSSVAGQGADLVVCPEMAVTGYVWPSPGAIRPYCEQPDGPTFAALSPLAIRHGCWIVAGFAERDGDRLFNSALIIDRQGRLVDCYRKVLLFDLDWLWARPGNRRPVFDTPFGRLGVGICMDLNDDRFADYLMQQEPDVVAFCTNWVDQGYVITPYWRERLGRWHGWLAVANTWGSDCGVPFYGGSTILSPARHAVVTAPPQGDCVLAVDCSIGVSTRCIMEAEKRMKGGRAP